MVEDNNKLNKPVTAYSKAFENINSAIALANKPVTAYSKVFENINSAIALANKPVTAYSKAFENINSAIALANKPVTAYSKAFENINSAIALANKPVTGYSKAFENINSAIALANKPVTAYSKAFENINSVIALANKPVTTYSKTFENINSAIALANKPVAAYSKAFENLANNLTELVKIIDFDSEEYSENINDVSIENTNLMDDKKSVEKLILLDEKIDLLFEKIEEINQNIYLDREQTKKSKKSFREYLNEISFILFSNLLIGIFFGFYGITTSSLEEFMVEKGKVFASSAIEYFESLQDNKEANTTRTLYIYQSSRKDSERLGSVLKGEEVEIIIKKRNWTKVRYLEKSNDTYKEGWVLTRYITQ